MYSSNNEYKSNKPSDYSRNGYTVVSYLNSNMSLFYESSVSKPVSKSPCECRGTCRTKVGCTCK